MPQRTSALALKLTRIRPHLNEAGLRLWAANEALSLGYGGVSAVSRATGISRTTIHAGMAELDRPAAAAAGEGCVRRSGGGRKRVTEKDPGLRDALGRLVDPVTRGDPESALRWRSKSTTKLARELTKGGHTVSQRTLCDLLAAEGYSLQSVRKTRGGAQRWHRSWHRRVCRRKHPPMVASDGKTSLSQCVAPDYYRGLRRQQRLPRAFMESGLAALRQ